MVIILIILILIIIIIIIIIVIDQYFLWVFFSDDSGTNDDKWSVDLIYNWSFVNRDIVETGYLELCRLKHIQAP